MSDYGVGLVKPVGGHIWGGIDNCVFHHNAEELASEGLKWSTIIATSTLEHTHNPFDFMKAVRSLLAEGGLLILTTPFMWTEHGDWQDDHWRFTRGGLKILAEMTDLNILDIGCEVFSHERSMSYLIASKGTLGKRTGNITIPELVLAD